MNTDKVTTDEERKRKINEILGIKGRNSYGYTEYIDRILIDIFNPEFKVEANITTRQGDMFLNDFISYEEPMFTLEDFKNIDLDDEDATDDVNYVYSEKIAGALKEISRNIC